MSLTWNPNLEDFQYGKVAEKVRSKRRPKKKSLVSDSSFLSSGTSSVREEVWVRVPPSETTDSVNSEKHEIPFSRGSIRRLEKAIEGLGLTHDETAKLLGIAKSTLTNALGAETDPSKSVKKGINNLIAIYRLLSENLKKGYLVKNAMRNPMRVFGGLSAVEFAKAEDRDVSMDVLAVFARTFE